MGDEEELVPFAADGTPESDERLLLAIASFAACRSARRLLTRLSIFDDTLACAAPFAGVTGAELFDKYEFSILSATSTDDVERR